MRDTKHLAKHSNKLAEKEKEKTLFRNQRKAVEAGAHGTLEYTIKNMAYCLKIHTYFHKRELAKAVETVIREQRSYIQSKTFIDIMLKFVRQ